MMHVDVKGAKVPALGFGTWALSGRGCYEAVRTALELGYRHIDTADMYGNEAEVGRAIRNSGLAREAIFLTTKVPPGKLRARDAKRCAEESLRRLGLDHVDLLLIHWPNSAVPLGETLGAFAELRAAGRARFIGVSNFPAKLLREAVERHGADLLCNQIEYHPYLSQRAVLSAARGYGMMVTAYSPVAKGRVARDAKLATIGRKYGKSGVQVALRWLVEQDGVAAIPKAGPREHIAANFDIFDFSLAAEDRATIAALADNRRLVDFGDRDWDPA